MKNGKLTRADVAHVMDYVYHEEIRSLREAGQKEYAHGENTPFGNFEADEVDLQIPRIKSLMLFLRKHLRGLWAYANGHRSQREDVRGRINDAITYLFILRAMIDEDEIKAGVAPGWANYAGPVCAATPIQFTGLKVGSPAKVCTCTAQTSKEEVKRVPPIEGCPIHGDVEEWWNR